MTDNFDEVLASPTRRVKRENVSHRKKSLTRMALERVSARTGLTVAEARAKLEDGWVFKETLLGWSWERP